MKILCFSGGWCATHDLTDRLGSVITFDSLLYLTEPSHEGAEKVLSKRRVEFPAHSLGVCRSRGIRNDSVGVVDAVDETVVGPR